jgi:tetratricopeptide (TPR) repeat protein
LPDVQKEPEAPQAIESVEDLYLAGRFVEQFSRPGVNPDDYYLEALKKSGDDYRVNIALGIRRVKQWRYEEAEKFLQKAADKLMVKYFQPKEGELFYYLALAQKGAGKTDDAYRSFFQATWYYEWFSSAYYQLALMESSRGDYAKALEFVEKAYSTNNKDGSIILLYSALLRTQGEREKALALVNNLLSHDPVNFSAIYEKELLQGNSSLLKWHRNMQDIDNNYLDIALTYVNAGLFDDAIRLLSSLENPKNPLVFYYLAWLYENVDQPSKANEMLASADKISFDYCFPFREETEKVLKYAIKKDTFNAVACYLLGNLLYDRRPDEAMKAWNMAIQAKKEFPMVWRNLAFGAFYHENGTEKAIEFMKKAIGEDSNHPLWYAELENYYDLSRADFRECLAIMEKNIDVVKMDVTAPQKLVKLYNLNGEYDKAIELLKSHHFRTWEGGREIYYHYVDAHTLKALELMNNGKYEAAMEALNAAMLYPENLEVGKPLDDERNAMIFYFLGKASDKMAQKKKAKEFYLKSTRAKNTSQWADLIYYQAKSCEELGNPEKAIEMFKELIAKGTSILERGEVSSGIGVEDVSLKNKSLSEAYYLQSLGYKGLGDGAKANNLLQKALQEYKNNLWAKLYLEKL